MAERALRANVVDFPCNRERTDKVRKEGLNL